MREPIEKEPQIIKTKLAGNLLKTSMMLLGATLFLSAPITAQTDTNEPDEVTSDGGTAGPGPITQDGGTSGPGPITQDGGSIGGPILSDDAATTEEPEEPAPEEAKKNPKPKKG